MTWHPTTNRIQTQLLTAEERSALEAWPHGLEYFNDGAWYPCGQGVWGNDIIYRGKSSTVVTSVWFNQHPYEMSGPYDSRHGADLFAFSNRIDVLRIDTCNGVSTAHLEGLE